MKLLLVSLYFSKILLAISSEWYTPCGFFDNPEELVHPDSLNSKIKVASNPAEIPLSFSTTLGRVERSDLDAFYLLEGNSLQNIVPTGFTDAAGAKDQKEAETIAKQLNKKHQSDIYFARYSEAEVPETGAKSKKVGSAMGWMVYEKKVTEEDKMNALEEADKNDPGYQHYPREVGTQTQIFRVVPKTPRKVPAEMTQLSSSELYLKFMNDSPKNKVVRFHVKALDNVTEYIPCDSANLPEIECLKLQTEELKKLNQLSDNKIKSIKINLEVNVNPDAAIESTARSEAAKVILDQEELRIVPSYKEKIPYKKEENNLPAVLAANCEIIKLEELRKEPQTPALIQTRPAAKHKHSKNILNDN